MSECAAHEYGCNNPARTVLYVECTVHPEVQTAVQKLSDFRCSQGNDWAFLLREEPLHRSEVLDLTGLYVRLRTRREAAACSDDDYAPEIWLLRADSALSLEPLILTHVPGTGAWQQDSEHYSSRHPEYVVTGDDGTEYLRFGVTIVDA